MSYQNEQGFGAGFLPGDNETGVVAYPLPEAVVSEIERVGMAFFEALGPEWQGWQPTPIIVDGHLPSPGPSSYDPAVSPLDAYLDRYGWWIEVDPAVKRAINDAMLQPDSYYRHGRGSSLVLVAPAAGQAFLIYAG